MTSQGFQDSEKNIFQKHLSAWITLVMVAIFACLLVAAAVFATNNMPENVGRPLSSEEQAEELWRIWYEHEVLTPVLGTPLAELDYDEIFKALPKERQEEIQGKKDYFLALCGDSIK